VLGITDVEVLAHPDGDLRWADVAAFHDEIIAAIARVDADAIITFGDDGLYWHLDHIGVHERTYTAVLSLGIQAPPLYCVTMAPGAMQRVSEAAVAKGWIGASSGFWGIEPSVFGDGAKPPTIIVDVGEWIPRKLAAIRCHRTQMGPNNLFATLDETEARQWLGIEHFHRAPIQTRGEPLLEQLNEPIKA
jgi:LmbE family N-acetylglucosaminyl deacetylase